MYDGDPMAGNATTVLGQFTGHVSAPPVTMESQTGQVEIHFQSDGSVNNIGFHILVTMRGKFSLIT